MIFDWDGVLAHTKLDFSSIRQRYFGGRDAAILEEMALMEQVERERLATEIRMAELQGASEATPVPGGAELVALLNERGIPWSVVSRNCPESIYLAAKTIGFSLPENTFHRESGPVKPSPEALWMASDAMGVRRESCTVVGDFVYDLLGARRAGMRAVLVERGEERWSHWADKAFPRMLDFLEKIREGSAFIPWEYHGLVDRLGIDWLLSVWNIAVSLPSPLTAADMELALKLASLGIGRFKVSEDPQPLDDWWRFSWLSPEFLDRPQVSIVRKVLGSRFPLVEVSTDGEALSLDRFRENPEETVRDLVP